jgi:malate permease and related proteins
MLEIYIKLLPVFAFFVLGVGLKTFKVANHAHGAFLLKFMFFVTLPVLILLKLTQTHIGLDKLYLPFMNIGINLACMLVMLLLTRFMQIERGTLGVMLVSSMIMNNVFIFPFILAVFTDQAFTDAVIFDIGNAVMTMTLTYVVAFRYGPDRAKLHSICMNVLKLPAIWALVVAVILNLNSIHLPGIAIDLLQPVSLLTGPLILIALGIYFTPRIKHKRLVAITVTVRMLFGLLIGLAISTIFGLQGETFMVVVLCSAAPIGFNALTYASLAKLDVGFAAGAVSTSILIAMIEIPLLMYLLQT